MPRIEKFASRARAYICTYHYLEHLRQQAAAAAVNEDPNSSATTTDRTPVAPIPTHIKQELLFSDIDTVKKDFKSHSCVLDFGNGFVHSEFRNAMRVEGDSHDNRMNL